MIQLVIYILSFTQVSRHGHNVARFVARTPQAQPLAHFIVESLFSSAVSGAEPLLSTVRSTFWSSKLPTFTSACCTLGLLKVPNSSTSALQSSSECFSSQVYYSNDPTSWYQFSMRIILLITTIKIPDESNITGSHRLRKYKRVEVTRTKWGHHQAETQT